MGPRQDAGLVKTAVTFRTLLGLSFTDEEPHYLRPVRFLALACLAACAPAARAPEPATVTLATPVASSVAPVAPVAPLAPPPRASASAPVPPPAGTLSVEDMKSVVFPRMDEINGCYERGLRRDNRLRGRVGIRFVIEPSGAVSSATDDGSSLPGADVVACIARVFTGLSFPPHEGESITSTIGFRFAPKP